MDLIEELPKEELPTDLEVVWEGSGESDFTEACGELRDMDIRYEVHRTVMGPKRYMDVECWYEIKVSPGDAKQAKAVLGTQSSLDPTQIPNEEAFELAESPTVSTPESRKRDPSFRKWHSADAVVEVFSQPPENTSSVVELSFKANYVRFRTEVSEDGTRRFFVVPEDEAIAREILREIREGTPPA